jgi:uridylate kinase
LRRILLKLSGEALAPGRTGPEGGFGIDPAVLDRLAGEIVALQRSGGQLAVVLGGGNLFRGAALQAAGMDRVTGDHMGMLATIMNGLAFRETLQAHGASATLFSALAVPGVVAGFSRDAALAALDQGQVVVLVAGTGNPFFTTDTAACLRAIELEAEAVLKATKVDGVYSADPLEDPSATRFDELSFDETLERQLGVMDLTAICLCRDHHMPIVVFDMNAKGALTAIINGDKVGTRIVAR